MRKVTNNPWRRNLARLLLVVFQDCLYYFENFTAAFPLTGSSFARPDSATARIAHQKNLGSKEITGKGAINTWFLVNRTDRV